MITNIEFLGNDTNGLKRYSIKVSIDKDLDLVEKLTGKISFSKILEISFHNLAWNNTLNLRSNFQIEIPIIEFSKLIHDDTESFEVEKISSNSLKGLEEELELKVLKSQLKWNKDFILYCLINLFPDLNETINFNELDKYYLNNNKYNKDYSPKNLRPILAQEKPNIDLLKEILSNLEIIKSLEFKPHNFKEEEFIGEKPKKSFLNKLTGQYKIDLKKYEDLKKNHLQNQQAKKEVKLQKIKKYKTLTNEFANDYIELIKDKIESIHSKRNQSEENFESKIKNLLDQNIINSYYKFKYELFLKNDSLLLEFFLPSFEDFLDSRNVKTTKTGIKNSEKEYKEICISIIFGLADFIFKNDNEKKIKQLYFNCFISFIDKSIGKLKENCIISISFSRDEFYGIDLNHIDLSEAFKKFNGLAASNISESISVRPIMTINREDKRFVENKDIIQSIDERTNLAIMDWEDFEHLIRDLFEKEFSSSGGEVKITQSSRDGGIDAIAFDPDPIRGGKIVIQSKRYTNVVGVSAVRDLYGTMINEGANKGILVTTSHFGSDAYQFSKNKPLSLIDGDNLLQLLIKHNFKAKIDIKEAREIRKNG
ncbi:restriction endonuclease [Algoriphagus sp. CAU 1675]|uniref:restriction endonuclease n=1 Tax=Algoriphagus sp. CAU 1675 TaxID=3032597 RepID=UPI0023DA45D3|nr:restriction endonuclease [Algoriphagus sp. CAU 1675]MDF2157289.1 restriction endonuclease [Algoriphagus sp. CAU 1675]